MYEHFLIEVHIYCPYFYEKIPLFETFCPSCALKLVGMYAVALVSLLLFPETETQLESGEEQLG